MGQNTPFHKVIDRHSIPVRDESTRMAAKSASCRLLIAMLRYGARNGGLPNLSAGECAARLDEGV